MWTGDDHDWSVLQWPHLSLSPLLLFFGWKGEQFENLWVFVTLWRGSPDTQFKKVLGWGSAGGGGGSGGGKKSVRSEVERIVPVWGRQNAQRREWLEEPLLKRAKIVCEISDSLLLWRGQAAWAGAHAQALLVLVDFISFFYVCVGGEWVRVEYLALVAPLDLSVGR